MINSLLKTKSESPFDALSTTPEFSVNNINSNEQEKDSQPPTISSSFDFTSLLPCTFHSKIGVLIQYLFWKPTRGQRTFFRTISPDDVVVPVFVLLHRRMQFVMTFFAHPNRDVVPIINMMQRHFGFFRGFFRGITRQQLSFADFAAIRLCLSHIFS